jgi:hypothetical protein
LRFGQTFVQTVLIIEFGVWQRRNPNLHREIGLAANNTTGNGPGAVRHRDSGCHRRTRMVLGSTADNPIGLSHYAAPFFDWDARRGEIKEAFVTSWQADPRYACGKFTLLALQWQCSNANIPQPKTETTVTGKDS